MPTNEERREVARNLRKLVRLSGSGSCHATSICNALGLIDENRYAPSAYYCGDGVMYLADLIEPEPERTCRMTKIGGDRVLAGWWECSECGPVYPPCKDEIAEWSLRKCPHCGAKVVDE